MTQEEEANRTTLKVELQRIETKEMNEWPEEGGSADQSNILHLDEKLKLTDQSKDLFDMEQHDKTNLFEYPEVTVEDPDVTIP